MRRTPMKRWKKNPYRTWRDVWGDFTDWLLFDGIGYILFAIQLLAMGAEVYIIIWLLNRL